MLGACLLGSACATTGLSAQDEATPGARLYGDYLAASYASYLNDAGARSTYYSRAFARTPQDLKLGRLAMTSAVSAGDMLLARTLAIEVNVLDAGDELSRAILGAYELSRGAYGKAEKLLNIESGGAGLREINALMLGWARSGLGQGISVVETFDVLDNSPYFQLMATLQKGKLYAQLGEFEKADAAFDKVSEGGISRVETVLSQARFALARGEGDKALETLTAFAEENGGEITGPVRAYINAIEAGETLEIELSPEQSASRALTDIAFNFFGRLGQYDAVGVFLRLAVQLDPDNDKAKLYLATILEETKRMDEALAIYMAIPKTSPYSVSARLSEANILFEADDNEQAIEILQAAHDRHPSRITKGALGRGHLIMENYGQALPVYDALIAELDESELKANPNPYYLRGICLERLERWQEAVVDFKLVLEYQPDNADALNYLGYTWVDKGVHLNEAFDMIRKAVVLRPDSGAIVDSLGWAHYKLGQYGQARIRLEEAAEKSPESATIIDHLGDVYWKLGRFREAGYQWRRARDLNPTDAELLLINAKLKDGLSASTSDQ